MAVLCRYVCTEQHMVLALLVAAQPILAALPQHFFGHDGLLAELAEKPGDIDFPDEDIAPATRSELIGRLEAGVALADTLLRTANEGRILRVVITMRGERIRVLTAFEPSRFQKNLYLERKAGLQ